MPHKALEFLKFLIVFGSIATAIFLLYTALTLESTREARDLVRINDLANLKMVITSASQDNNKFCQTTLRNICASTSLSNIRTTDGHGWVKLALASSQVTLPILPVDPLNNKGHHYIYCADSTGWEIIAKLESKKFLPKMSQDDGSNSNFYEIGTNFKLLGTGDCNY